MHILLLSQYFPPEVGATQNRMASFARAIKSAGHRVTVICEVPNHPQGIISPPYRRRCIVREDWQGIAVIRVFVLASPRKTFLRRLAFYISFALMSVFAGLRLKERPDIVLATSPPIFTGVSGCILAAWRRCPFVLDVRDLWPAAAVALGEIRSRLLVRASQGLERLLYRRASLVLGATRPFVQHIAACPGSSPAVLVPNGTDPQLFSPRNADPSLRSRHGLEGKFVAVFAGNLGLAQALDLLIEAAALLRRREDIIFMLIGAGPMRESLRDKARSLGAENVIFLPQVGLKQAAAWMQAADLLIATLNSDPLFCSFVPSKLYDYMACGRPVLTNVGGETARLVKDAACGVCVPPGDAAALAKAIQRLAERPEEMAQMGRKGREFVQRHFDRERIGEQLIGELTRLLHGTSQQRRKSVDRP